MDLNEAFEAVTARDLLGDGVKYSREAWLDKLPFEVQSMALKYPPATRFYLHGKICHLICYREDGVFMITELDPCDNYELALKACKPICECCLPKLDSLIIVKEL